MRRLVQSQGKVRRARKEKNIDNGSMFTHVITIVKRWPFFVAAAVFHFMCFHMFV